jgi:hypothetical protein
MAYTTTLTKSVFGNKSVALCNVTADAASGTIVTGLSVIEHWTVGPQSMATSSPKIAASGGTITVSNAASGDLFYLTVYGR